MYQQQQIKQITQIVAVMNMAREARNVLVLERYVTFHASRFRSTYEDV